MEKKKLTPADEKFIAKFLNSKNEIDFDAKRITRKNRFTGEEFEVDPISAAAIDFVFRVESALRFQDERRLKLINPELKLTNAVSNFDRARMLVLKMNQRAYMGILD
jgi:hypothetical protein